MKTSRGAIPATVIAMLCAAASPSGAGEAPAPGGTAEKVSRALADTLSFEFADATGAPAGWVAAYQPARWDSTEAHAGRASARFQRDASSAGDFSSISRRVPAEFAGDSLTLVGWIRTEGVSEFAGLWLREDARGGTVQFDNMGKAKLQGTTPWTEYRVTLPLDKKARTILFGALVAGTGTAWVDDLRLLMDGKPYVEAPRVAKAPSPADDDHEFDAGSRLDVSALAAARPENLLLLAKAWGFLKYHHPRVTSGGINWDYELFRALPAVARARNHKDGVRAIVRWIDRIGMPAACQPCAAEPKGAVLAPPIQWIHDTKLLTRELSSRLERIHRNRPAGDEQYYVASSAVGNVTLSENGYTDREYPDAGYRLLALARFWNVIEYWFPYRDLIRPAWDSVFTEFVPRVLAAGDRDAYRLTMIDLVARVHDTHANVWNALDTRPPVGKCRLPVAVRPVEDRFVVAAYVDSVRGAASGLRVGDEILALDGARVDSLSRIWAPHYAASNEAARRRDIGRFLTQGPCGTCRVSVRRAGVVQAVDSARDTTKAMGQLLLESVHDLAGPAFRTLGPDVAYLKLSRVAIADIDSYLARAEGTRCLVIDIRNYPREFVVFALGSHLVDQPTPFAKFTKCDIENAGAFAWTDSVVIEPEAPPYRGKVVILVDEMSQSQAEYTTMAFRAVPGALVVGSTTAGADGNVSPIPLPGGLRALMSGIGVFYPDGKPTQQIGIVPDLIVRPTINGIREGRDEVLEAALEAALGRQVQVPVPVQP